MSALTVEDHPDTGDPESWRMWSRCADTDPDSFFTDNEEKPETAAKRVCAACPVRENCLLYAIANNERHGVWGGLTPDERDAEARRRGLARGARTSGTRRTRGLS